MKVPKMKYSPSAICNVCKEQKPCVLIPFDAGNGRGTLRICSRCLRDALKQTDVIHKETK